MEKNSNLKKIHAQLKWEADKEKLRILAEIYHTSFFTMFRKFREIKSMYRYCNAKVIRILQNGKINEFEHKFLEVKENQQLNELEKLSKKYNYMLRF